MKTTFAGAAPLASLLAAATLLAPLPAAARKKQDTMPAVGTLIDNVAGETPDGRGGIARFEAVLVGPDGRVLDVYAHGQKRPDRVAYRLDGGGRVLVPGLIDSHAHVMATGFAKLTLDLSGTRSLDEALSRVRAWAAAHPDAPWLLGRGWDVADWGGEAMPTAAQLDAATAGKPAWFESADGHSGWANSAAIRAAGISAATADPAGGRIVRAAGSRAPAGVFVDTAMDLVAARMPRPRPEDVDTALAEAQLVFLRNGVTSVADMGTTIEDWQAMRRAADLGNLRMRIVSYADGIDNMQLIGGPGPTPWLYDDRLRMVGLELGLDGTLASRGAWLKADYADAPGQKGDTRLNSTQLGNLMSRAALDKFQVAVASSGDEAGATALDTIQQLEATYKGDRRWRIERARVLDPADIARFGRLSVIASMQPAATPSGQQVAAARLGPARLAGTQAWNAIAATGSTLAFGSGSPAVPPAPFAGMAAATGGAAPGAPPAISREAALSAYTAGAATAMFADDRLGRIAKGYRADFVFVDRDPLAASPQDLGQARVLETWVGGQQVWSAARDAAKLTPSRSSPYPATGPGR